MQKQPVPRPVGITLGDIYYILFRRKWMILIFAVLGIAGAFIAAMLQKPMYQSQASLLIRYVEENKPVDPSPGGSDSRIKPLNDQVDSIINSELSILQSLDLAREVAETFGPEKILAASGGGNDAYAAAVEINQNLFIELPRRSSVLLLTFHNGNAKIVQPVLTQIITTYLKRHAEIYHPGGEGETFLATQIDNLKSELSKTEGSLRKAKQDVGVLSLDDTKRVVTEQISRIRQELDAAEADHAYREGLVKSFTGTTGNTNETNAMVQAEVPAMKMAEYKAFNRKLDFFTARKNNYEGRYTEENALMKEALEQIEIAENGKQELEKQFPQLTNIVTVSGESTPAINVGAEKAQMAAVAAKIATLTNRLGIVLAEAKKMESKEAEISELERSKKLKEGELEYYSKTREIKQLSDAMNAGKVSGINLIQQPSQPTLNASKTKKIAIGILVCAILFGLGFAFFIELILDRTVKRPIEIERKLHIPLLLTVPDQDRSKGFRLRDKKQKQLLLAEKNGDNKAEAKDSNEASVNGKGAEIAPWDDRHSLRPFYEGLRDRLITYFEVRNLKHNPKLIALAGCAKGSGVSTMAAGLAACLSETGDGNVLLVDMNVEHGSAQKFYQGKPTCDLTELLDSGKKDNAQVQNNLYVVHEGNSDLLPRNLPKKFSYLVPKLKASDYDYIIFDMPPVSQISVTPRLAGFMDMIMLVIESEKTDRTAVERAHNMLLQSNANVTAILNKTHNYVPHRLHQEMPLDEV